MKKMNWFCSDLVYLNQNIESHCMHLELNFNSTQFNLTINGINIQLKKNQMQIVRKSTCEYVIEKENLIHRYEMTHFHFHAFLLGTRLNKF